MQIWTRPTWCSLHSVCRADVSGTSRMVSGGNDGATRTAKLDGSKRLDTSTFRLGSPSLITGRLPVRTGHSPYAESEPQKVRKIRRKPLQQNALRIRVTLPQLNARSESNRCCPRLVSSLFTALKVAAAAFVRVWRFVNPCEFSADLCRYLKMSLASHVSPITRTRHSI